MKDTPFQKEKSQIWQSYELRGTDQEKELQKQEYYTSPDPIIKRIKEGKFERKNFLRLMGASVAMATLNCVQKPVEKIVPYVDIYNKDEKQIYDFVRHGLNYHYASVCNACSAGCGTIVKARDGRPLKLEGNPNHPVSNGALCSTGQASLHDLYDPDRAKEPAEVVNGALKFSDWVTLDTAVIQALSSANNKGKTRVVTKPISSPSSRAIIAEFLKETGGGKHYEIDLTSPEEVISLAQEISYGKAIVPNYHFDKAEVIVSIDCDFMGTWLSPVEFQKAFSKRRDLSSGQKSINTFIAAESHPTMTGSNADQRIPLRSGDQRKFALALAKALTELGVGGASGVADLNVSKLAEEMKISEALIRNTAKALNNAKGNSLVVAGGTQALGEDGLDLHIAVNMLNSMLGNDGRTVDHGAVRKDGRANYSENYKTLKNELISKEVGVLIIQDVNLAYQTTDNWKEILHNAGLVVSVTDRVTETAQYANYIAPASHFLESWGDSEGVSGALTIQQPTIRPLFDTRSLEESLIAWNGKVDTDAKGKTKLTPGKLSGASNYYEYVKSRWSGKGNWEDNLRSGIFFASSAASLKGDRGGRSFRASIAPLAPVKTGVTYASLYTSVALRDGKQANLSVQQELPDPVSKVTWDNYLAISPEQAKIRNLKLNDLVRVKAGKESVELPVLVQVGMHAESVAIAVGYGRTNSGVVGNGVGKNVYPFVKYDGKVPQFSGIEVDIEKLGKTYKLATTQDHHMMTPGEMMGKVWKERPLILSAKIEEYNKDPKTGIPEVEIPKMLRPNAQGKTELLPAEGANPPFPYNGYRWGMAVDLTQCTGCGACVTACSIENNVPMVGRDEVRVGREMHWMRIDRYYIGDPDKPESLQIAHQPLMCQHCESAPCETVCPVAATVHSSEGTNDMVYNRCVGTRYCSNNCPYKVRRYNWMEHWTDTDKAKAPRHLAFNPDVTVRARGVMEKCSFCAGRVAYHKIQAKNEGRKLHGDEIKSACQETCPSNAIVFGNINDPDSKVSKLIRDPRAYRILEFLQVKPSVSYLTRVRSTV